MLDSTVAMLKLFFALMLFFIQDAPVSISSPQPGDELRGQVEITGSMTVPNFASAELAFNYAASTSADNWFAIQTFPQPVPGPALAVWDTASITDGNYTLRLRVFLEDGSFQDSIVSDLKISNDVPIPAEVIQTETSLPQFSAAAPLPVLIESPAAAVVIYPSATPLPTTPATVTTASIYSTFGRGALVVLAFFLFFFLLLRLRRSA